MGTEFNIKVYGIDSVKVINAVNKAWQKIDDVNAVFSDYVQNSELAEIHRTAGNPTKVTNEFLQVLTLSNSYSKASNGAFDISVGALSRLWRRSIKLNEFPSKEKIVQAKNNVGYQKIKIKGNEILIPKNMYLDFGAIAKGYAVDEAYKVLSAANFSNSMVDGGGDLFVGESIDPKGWSVLISLKKNNEWIDSIYYLKNKGVAASGDKYKYIEDEKGIRYAHIINPNTGYGIKGPLLTTVIAENATHADALATTLSVNPKSANKIRKRLKIDFAMIK